MGSIDDYTDEELGRMVKQAAGENKAEFETAIETRNDFVQFLERIGLTYLAGLIKDAIAIWEGIKKFFRKLFV